MPEVLNAWKFRILTGQDIKAEFEDMPEDVKFVGLNLNVQPNEPLQVTLECVCLNTKDSSVARVKDTIRELSGKRLSIEVWDSGSLDGYWFTSEEELENVEINFQPEFKVTKFKIVGLFAENIIEALETK